MNIITITLNPAVDVHVNAPNVLDAVNGKCIPSRRDCGGKGVNASRALLAVGIDSLCCVAVGCDGGDEYVNSLIADGLNLYAVPADGRVRENLHIHTPSGDFISTGAGACVENEVIERIEAELSALIDRETYVVFSGSIPNGTDKGRVVDMLLSFSALGAKVMLDSRSFNIDDISAVRPYLIKPNGEEFEDLVGEEGLSFDQISDKLTYLCNNFCENVLLTLGADGAIMASRGCESHIYAKAPKINVLSTTGAGDASLAGFIYASLEDRGRCDIMRISMAFGAAACAAAGSLAPNGELINDMMDKIKVLKD